jgi:calcium/calmodulin-dependent protein kinase kinase 2
VKLWEVIDDFRDEKLYLVMDYFKKGAVMSPQYWREEEIKVKDLTQSIQNLECKSLRSIESSSFNPRKPKRALSEERCRKYSRDLVMGLEYLHSHCGVIHRDIKPQNMMITEDDRLKIGDFGVSQICEKQGELVTNQNGTKCYMAPELWNCKPHFLFLIHQLLDGTEKKGRPIDIWAAGCTLFYFATGCPPFFANDLEALKKSILESEPEYPKSINEDMADLIKKCLEKDPKRRITVEEMLDHPWITSGGQNPLKRYEGSKACFEFGEAEVKAALTKRHSNSSS